MRKSLLLLIVLMPLVGTIYAQNVKAPVPYGVLPTKDQIAWQKMEYYMFIHFGPNTFTDKEWGHGDENPIIFNPTQLDANQWAKTAKAAGMKGIIITAKHHDGFCLWPSKYSTHTVRESAWKDGKGDVLRELSDACKKQGLKFGVYLSPWDRNHPAYGTPEYNQIFANTLEEVLTNYGEVFEQWFDGANGELANGRKQEYNWPLFHRVVYKHQPKAIIFSDIGPGTRWIGNENGIAGETNWSTLNIAGFGVGNDAPKQNVLNNGNENGTHWIPGEADVSIRPGWFYSSSTDTKVKSLNKLITIYNSSVGRNSNLLLNVPVDRRGLIHANDSTRLMELKKVLDETFKTNIARGKKINASSTRGNAKKFAAQNLLDGSYDTYWTTDEAVKAASFTIDLGLSTSINRIVLQEYIPLGQRVKSFSVDYWDGKQYKQIDKQTTIGYKRILVFPTLNTSKIRVNILEANACPVLSEIQLFKAPEILALPEITRNKQGLVTISSESADAVIVYTTNGAEPLIHSTRYSGSFNFFNGGTVKARTYINKGKTSSETVSAVFELAPTKWKIIATDVDQMTNIIDDDPKTWWISPASENVATPHSITIDMGETIAFKGFTYTPRQDGQLDGIIYQYNFYVSTDGINWQKVVNKGAFANIKNNPTKQYVKSDKQYQVRYIKLEALTAVNDNDYRSSAAEIGVIVN